MDELRDRAKTLGLEGISTMNKSELEQAVLDAEAVSTPDDVPIEDQYDDDTGPEGDTDVPESEVQQVRRTAPVPPDIRKQYQTARQSIRKLVRKKNGTVSVGVKG